MNGVQINKKVRVAQRTEITEHLIYKKLSQTTKDAHNRDILRRISRDEMRHYHLWKDYTKQAEKPLLLFHQE